MSTIVSDTHKLISQLQTKGFSKEQAEGFTEALQELDFQNLATKDDLKDLKLDVYKAFAAQTIVLIGAIVTLLALLN